MRGRKYSMGSMLYIDEGSYPRYAGKKAIKWLLMAVCQKSYPRYAGKKGGFFIALKYLIGVTPGVTPAMRGRKCS